jgi:hypothetical protein
MSQKIAFASLGVFQVMANRNVVVESIGVLINEVSLSGAWVLSPDRHKELELVLTDRLLFRLGEKKLPSDLENRFKSKFVNLSDLVCEGASRALVTMEEYEKYKAEKPNARKKLVAPQISDWEHHIDLNNAADHLANMGKVSSIFNTPDEMQKVLTASRLLQILVTNWQCDEQVRSEKKYVPDDLRNLEMLPKSWLLRV